MFHSARLKLTAWYLLIIVFISGLFSVAIYQLLTVELDRVERVHMIAQEKFPDFENLPPHIKIRLPKELRIDPQLITDTKNRLKHQLLLINLVIFGASGILGYFLAGRTLRPIKEMVDDQNRFIADASHELRTPLTSLKSEIEVSLRDKKLTLNEAKNILKSNLEEVLNLEYLSDNLLKLAQQKVVNGNKYFENVLISDLAAVAVKKVAKLAKSKSINVLNETQPIRIRGEKQNLQELLVIFLDNAIKYSPEKRTVQISTRKKERAVEIEIKDEGIGIEKKEIPKLFDRFYRSDIARTKSGSTGYGLGLSIAKQIVENHNGSIKVSSAPGKGTTFTVKLPIL